MQVAADDTGHGRSVPRLDSGRRDDLSYRARAMVRAALLSLENPGDDPDTNDAQHMLRVAEEALNVVCGDVGMQETLGSLLPDHFQVVEANHA